MCPFLTFHVWLFKLSLNRGQCSPRVSPWLTQRPIWCLSDPIQVLIRCPVHPSADKARSQSKQIERKLNFHFFLFTAQLMALFILHTWHPQVVFTHSSSWTYIKPCRRRCESESGDFFWRGDTLQYYPAVFISLFEFQCEFYNKRE